MKHIKLFESYITEGKIEDLIKLYSDKNDSHEISTLKIYAQNSSSNFQWLLKNYTKDKKKYKENISGVNILLDVLDDYFKRYLRIKNNLTVDKRDINSIKSTKELIDIVNEYNDYHEMLEDSGIDVLFDNEKWIIFIPKTFIASNKWGWGRFCTSNDETYFNYYNIKNNSLVYVMHKFDYTKNIVIECFPNGYFQIWNYEDDNTSGSIYMLRNELGEINDGFLEVDEILDELPYVDMDDLREHLANLLFTIFELDDINQILNSDLKEKNLNHILNFIKTKVEDIYDLRGDIRDSI